MKARDVIHFKTNLFFQGIPLNCAPLLVRKIAAILLICLLVFNWYGYRFVTNYFQKQADTQLEAKIDVNDYDESQLLEIRVPLDIPYQNSASGFERHYGEIEFNGKIYAFVKRKVENGCLVLKCIPNTVKENIKNADNILFATNNGFDQEHNSKSNSPLTNIFKSIFSDYDDCSQSYNLKNVADNNQKPPHTGISFFHSVCLPVSEQPPEVA
jgi:hypothetical protein